MPTLLFESYDLALGGPKSFESWWDCGTVGPVKAMIAQSRQGRPKHEGMRWVSAVYAPGNDDPLHSLAKSELKTREVDAGDVDSDKLLAACREDAHLLAERADLILGAIAKATKK